MDKEHTSTKSKNEQVEQLDLPSLRILSKAKDLFPAIENRFVRVKTMLWSGFGET